MNLIEAKQLLNIYLDSSRDLFAQCNSALKNGICIYGLGFVGQWAFEYLTSNGSLVKFCIDNDPIKTDSFFLGVPIISSKSADFDGVNAIVVGSRHAASSIIHDLRDIDLPKISIDAYVVHQYIDSHLTELEAYYCHDKKSLLTLYCVLLTMLSGDRRFLRPVTSSHSLFSEYDFFNLDNEVYVDAGAYVGDTFEKFLWSVNGIFNKAFLFEPGLPQYSAQQIRIRRLVDEWCLRSTQIICNNCAVGASNSMIKFSHSHSLTQSSSMRHDSMNSALLTSLRQVSLDSYFADKNIFPTLIKVDIEGAESQLLQGALKLISSCMPRIILSVYHFPSDIFLLPSMVLQSNPAYRLSLRHHSSKLMETILYCH